MTADQFEDGIRRLVGNYGSSISKGIVAELDNRYRGASGEEWQALISRVIENCKNAPRLAHFRELEQGMPTFKSDSERLRRTCGLCKRGYLQKFAKMGCRPYKVLVPCPCSPELLRGGTFSNAPIEFIGHDEYLELLEREKSKRAPPRPSSRKAAARGPTTPTSSLAPPEEPTGPEELEERRAIAYESIRAEIDAGHLDAAF